MTYRDDMTLVEICLREGDAAAAEKIVRQIVERYPIKGRMIKLYAWFEGDQEFLARLKERK